MFTSALIILCLCGQSSAPFLPAPPKSGYESVVKKTPPVKIQRKRRKKKNFELGLSLNYDRAWLGESTLEGLSWAVVLGQKKGFGFEWGISYLFEEGTSRWDMLFRAGVTYNWHDTNAFNYVFKLGFTFDTIAMPDDYVTSQADQMQFGWYTGLGIRIKVWRATHLSAEISYMDLYANADPGDKAIVPNMRGLLLNLGLSWLINI